MKKYSIFDLILIIIFPNIKNQLKAIKNGCFRQTIEILGELEELKFRTFAFTFDSLSIIVLMTKYFPKKS
mgnify:CR=1 FL=1